MVTGSAVLKRRFGLAAALVTEQLARTVAATGQSIADGTKANMYPGHFEDTSLSKEETCYVQTGPLSGAVQIPTDYAAFPEYGTSTMAPRPALTPAIREHWPATLHAHWANPSLGPTPPITGLKPPVSRP